jgi:hypothetical protein
MSTTTSTSKASGRPERILFTDIKDRSELAVKQIKGDIARLEARKTRSADDVAELARLKTLDVNQITKEAQRDPLLVAVSHSFKDDNLVSLAMTVDPTPEGEIEIGGRTGSRRDVSRVALVIGLLDLRKIAPPRIVRLSKEDPSATPDPKDDHHGPFVEGFVQALSRAMANARLATIVLDLMVEALDIKFDEQPAKISALEFARIVDGLIARRIKPDDANIRRYVDESLSRVQLAGVDKPIHEEDISLPDLEATIDHRVVRDNVRSVGPVLFASMFDELKAFRVVDWLVESARRGELSLVKGEAGTQLYQYWRNAPNRMSDIERQTFYAITLGVQSGQPGVSVNSEFQDLWLRFVSSVSTLVREARVENLLRSNLPFSINQQQVKKAGRDLVANMSLFGYGMAYYAAVDLQNQIKEMIKLLSDRELCAAVGARDMWGVIDQIAQTELGGARNSSKYRTLATSGAIITAWLGENLDRLRDATSETIRIGEIESPVTRPAGVSPTDKPTDYDLVNACELWLADSAMSEDRVEMLSQPRESPQQPSRPINMPKVARDLLEGVGLGYEMGVRNGAGRPLNGRGSAAYQSY